MFTQFQRFLLSHGLSAFATGVHVVALAWVSLTLVDLSSEQWAWVQAAGLVPMLGLMPLAGALADRRDPIPLLVGAQFLMAAAFGALAWLAFSQSLSFSTLVLYGLVVGSGSAFLQPLREKCLAEFAPESAQRRISLFSLVQFSCQALGMLGVALTEALALWKLLGLQAFIAGLAALQFTSLIRQIRVDATRAVSTLKGFREVLHHVRGDRGTWQLLALVAFNGYMHLGVFLVLVPLMATRDYAMSATQYAFLQVLFLTGMILAHAALLIRAPARYPGQGALFTLLYTALIGIALAREPLPAGFCLLILFWGMVAGNSAGRCRLVLQTLCPPSMRGRMMAIYQWTLFSTAPLGALVTGYCLSWMTKSEILWFMAYASGGLFVVFMATKTLWSVEQTDVVITEDPEK